MSGEEMWLKPSFRRARTWSATKRYAPATAAIADASTPLPFCPRMQPSAAGGRSCMVPARSRYKTPGTPDHG